MFNTKYSNILTVLLVIAIIAIVLLIGYFGYDIYRKYYSKKSAEDAVDAFQEQFYNTQNKTNTTNKNDTVVDNNIQIDELNTTTNSTNNSVGTTTNKPTTVKTTYEGYTVGGTIEISKISLKSPILESVSIKALETSVCLLYGDLNQVGNSVIIGHNYRNGTFFSNLKKLSNGDTIYITDYTNQKVKYTVYSIFEAQPEDTSFYDRDTNGLREITLSTCTDDSSMRTIVLAKES